MIRLIGAGLVAGVLAGCGGESTAPAGLDSSTGPLSAPSTTITNDVSTLAFSAFVPCANGGAGEEVIFSGRMHTTLHLNFPANGEYAMIKLHSQPLGVKGVGTLTGDQYRSTGVTQELVSVKKGTTSTFVNIVRLIGQGPGNNLVIHHVRHLTINANGIPTVVRGYEEPTVECGGDGPGGDA